MTVNKTEALARLTALEAEATKLRAILEAPVAAPSLLKRKGDLHTWCRIDGSSLAFNRSIRTDPDYNIRGENYFESTKQADDYASAFETFLLLRRQPGTTVPVAGKLQWLINGSAEPDNFQSMEYKISKLSPMFDNRSDCDAAIAAIGQTRLLHMFNTFHHIGG